MSNTPTNHELKESLKQIRESLPILLESQVIFAEITRAKYLSLRLKGFTEQQAIELCKT